MSTKHYFVCGNTAKGFCNYFRDNIQSLSKLFILKGGPGTGKDIILREIGKELEELQYDVDYIHCASDSDSLDGIIVQKLGVGIVNGCEPHVIEPTVPGAIEEYVNLGVCWNTDLLATHTNEIISIQNKIKECYTKAYAEFANGLKVHDEWEKIYIENMDFSKANQLTEDVTNILFGTTKFNKTSCTKDRFFGASTPFGAVNFVENITENYGQRFFIKGRPGSGKSTMLKKILEKAKGRGIDAEVYHCAFDPDSLDMLLFPELNICIFDSTAPHEFFPSREGDSIIDMYAELINANTDDIYKTQLAVIAARYKEFINEGTINLSRAKGYYDELEKIYMEATDIFIINNIYKELNQKIKNIINVYQ